MKSRETLIRLKKFQVDEKRRKVAQIEAMIAEFDRIAAELDREIKHEQDRAGIHDPAHFAYPTYAKAAIGRRENLKRSADELKVQVDDAKAALGEAFEELKKVEMLDERDHAREKAEANAREQGELDRIAAMRFSAGGAHGRGRFVEFFLPAAGDRHARALTSQLTRHLGAEAGGGSGDQDAEAFHRFHGGYYRTLGPGRSWVQCLRSRAGFKAVRTR